MKLVALAFLPIIMFSGSSGCLLDPDVTISADDSVTDSVDEAVAVIDKGINDINTGSADWQTVLQRVAKDLPEDISANIRVDAQSLADRSIASSGVEFRFNNDYLARRAVQSLENLKAELLGKAPPVLPPALSHVVLPSVDINTLSSSRSTLSYFGYDLDHRDSNGDLFKIFAITDQGTKLPIPEDRIGRTTHYEATVNLGGLQNWLYEQKVRKLTFEWNGSSYDQGEVVIVPWEPQIKSSDVVEKSSSAPYIPPLISGDADFDTDPDPDSYNPTHIRLEGRMYTDGKYIKGKVYMWAQENGGDRDKQTIVEGWSPESIFYTAPEGWEIIEFQPSSPSFVNADIVKHDDTIYNLPAGEVVNAFNVWVDQKGPDAGTYTRVVVDWRRLSSVTVRQTKPEWYN